MAYTTKEKLINAYNQQTLVDLTDDNDTGSVVDGVLSEVITRVSGIIDNYLEGIYDTPLSTTPAIIEDCANKMVLAALYDRGDNLAAPEKVEKDEDNAKKVLMSVATGKLKLGIGTTPTEPKTSFFHSAPRRFNPWGSYPRTSPLNTKDEQEVIDE